VDENGARTGAGCRRVVVLLLYSCASWWLIQPAPPSLTLALYGLAAQTCALECSALLRSRWTAFTCGSQFRLCSCRHHSKGTI